MSDDRRLIEDYLPIVDISAEASREKSVRKGHISTLHLWWARRPLVACRAAVYGALVPLKRFRPQNGPEEKRDSLTRANAARFVKELCKYPGSKKVIAEAERHILEAHAERLTAELGRKVTVEDVVEGRAPRPKVLDMFAGGGAIPLEALRLGCEAYALDLNPVAHIIELCTLVYPQKYGKPDPNARGMTGPKNDSDETTWGGLANEVRYWGEWVLEKVKAEIGDLYTPIPDPEAKPEEIGAGPQGKMAFAKDDQHRLKARGRYLTPVAYLWTRTVKCKNPACGATVPLVRQTWLCRKKGRCVALKTVAEGAKKRVRFEVVSAAKESDLGFDPTAGSKGGNATCPFCGTVATDADVRQKGLSKDVSSQLMSLVCVKHGKKGKVYLSADSMPDICEHNGLLTLVGDRLDRTGIPVPHELINPLRPSPWTRGASGVTRHGLMSWADLFNPRQLVCLLSSVRATQEAERVMEQRGLPDDARTGVMAYLAVMIDRQADYSSTLCRWDNSRESLSNTFSRQALAMVWDYCELNPFGEGSGSPLSALGWIVAVIESCAALPRSAFCARGSAPSLPWPDQTFDAIITDPPYYDNIPYADISDFFYVWLKRTVGHLHPAHFAGDSTPKRNEATALSSRHHGDMNAARAEYESNIRKSLLEACRVLKPGGACVVVYAHKTTLGWATLVEAIRSAGFMVVEAWPLDTEMRARVLAAGASALASSIFLVATPRSSADVGDYESEVRPQLERIVQERVASLWEQGVSGADLVISCVGAGLRPFTRHARVEYANGQEVPTERFLSEVETVVLGSILNKLSERTGAKGTQHDLAGVDPSTRFYLLWRHTYGAAEQDSGEAIIFANGTNVELDGPNGLSSDPRPLLMKKKSTYRLLDFTERGNDARLGLPEEDGQPAPVVDALHRTLWLMENRPVAIPDFLREAQSNLEQMRLVAQALGGPALKGGELAKMSPAKEEAALAKLTSNWRSVIEGSAFTREREDIRTGQAALDLG